MKVLVDSSSWIAYLRGTGDTEAMDWLIDENLVVTNDLILAELLPSLLVRGNRPLARLLREIERSPLDVDWEDVIRLQTVCLRNGINNVGIPDLIVAQNAIQHGIALLSLDRHFTLLARHEALKLF